MDAGSAWRPPTRRVLAGRYELVEPIGRGGSAVVHRARDLADGRPVAVKLFTATGDGPAPDGVVARRRDREMRVLTGLDHPGLVTVLDTGFDDVDDRRPYLVMELVEGTTLSAARIGGPMPPERVVRFGRELADALTEVHAHGITHRDVTPANVMLDASGHARLTDFGIALLVDQTRLTATGAVIGTAAYMSPEQICGEPVGPPTDVYALGLVLLETLTGSPAYAGTGREAALARLTRPPEIPPGLPGPLRELLSSMTAQRPQDRPTAARVAAVLAGAHPSSSPTVPLPAVPAGAGHTVVEQAVPPPRRSRSVPVAAAALVLVGLAAGVWSWAGSDDEGAGPAPVAAPPAALPQQTPTAVPTPTAVATPGPAPVLAADTAPSPVVRATTPTRAPAAPVTRPGRAVAPPDEDRDGGDRKGPRPDRAEKADEERKGGPKHRDE